MYCYFNGFEYNGINEEIYTTEAIPSIAVKEFEVLKTINKADAEEMIKVIISKLSTKYKADKERLTEIWEYYPPAKKEITIYRLIIIVNKALMLAHREQGYDTK